MKAASDKGVYEVVWPRGKSQSTNVHLAKRLDTLQCKTICELWDWSYRGREIFPVIEKALANRYPGCNFVSFEEFGTTHVGRESELIVTLADKLRQNGCDAVISGIGC
ncbi:MAG: hypothetical protein HYY32_01425 [Chloroflexi bacterium]|nr:hypothetical protein [Chloroflexota bacterium]